MTSTLSLEMVNDLIAESRTRGEYLADVKKFFASGELAIDFSAKYPKKEAASLRNSVKQNVDKIEGHPAYQIVVAKNGDGSDKSHVVLINMDVYRLTQQADEA